MRPRHLFLCLGLYALLRPTCGVEAGSAAAIPPGSDLISQLPEDLEKELRELIEHPWKLSGSAVASLGYRENPELSSFKAKGRAFAGGELEGFAWRLPRKGWESILMVNGSFKRFFDPTADTAWEHLWFMHGEERWTAASGVRLSASTQLFFQQQVVDISATEASRVVLPVQVYGGIANLSARFPLPLGLTVETIAGAQRNDFRDIAEDNTEPKALLKLERKFGSSWLLELTGELRRRDYAERTQSTLGGRSLPGTHLRLAQRAAQAKAAYTTEGSRGKWSSSLVLRGSAYRDQASGFFDYDQTLATVSTTWSKGSWELSLEASASHYRYLTQTVGAGLNPDARRRDDLSYTLKAERGWGEHWKLGAELTFERCRTNLENSNYQDSVYQIVLKREF
jgi:hypothetical protein